MQVLQGDMGGSQLEDLCLPTAMATLRCSQNQQILLELPPELCFCRQERCLTALYRCSAGCIPTGLTYRSHSTQKSSGWIWCCFQMNREEAGMSQDINPSISCLHLWSLPKSTVNLRRWAGSQVPGKFQDSVLFRKKGHCRYRVSHGYLLHDFGKPFGLKTH